MENMRQTQQKTKMPYTIKKRENEDLFPRGILFKVELNTISLNLVFAVILHDFNGNIIIILQGWVNALQYHKNVTFIKVSDGSTLSALQVVIPPELNTE